MILPTKKKLCRTPSSICVLQLRFFISRTINPESSLPSDQSKQRLQILKKLSPPIKSKDTKYGKEIDKEQTTFFCSPIKSKAINSIRKWPKSKWFFFRQLAITWCLSLERPEIFRQQKKDVFYLAPKQNQSMCINSCHPVRFTFFLNQWIMAW